MRLRNYWRIALLVILLVLSIAFLFTPVGQTSDAPQAQGVDTPTNLQFSIGLSGGIRVRAPLNGYTAEGVDVTPNNTEEIVENVASNLNNVSTSDIEARYPSQSREKGAVEVTDETVTKEAFETALQKSGYNYEKVRQGVTAETRSQTIEVLRDKVNEAGLSGGEVREITTATGDHLVLIAAPNRNLNDIVELAKDRGKVVIEAYYPVTQNGTTVYKTETVLEREDLQSIGQPQNREGYPPNVPVVVKDDAAGEFNQSVVSTGVAQDGGTTCTYETTPQETQPCLLTKVDGEVVYSAGMSPSLSDSILKGDWVKDPSFILQTGTMEEARELSINLRAGALPASINVQSGGASTSYTSPTQGAQFKKFSLIIGLLAVLAVSLVAYIRYRELRIAGSMVLTAVSEVVLLLGFAAAIKYPIDLATIAGLVAVVGTGVDDLIIITNEIFYKEQGIHTLRAFKKRFRKALWVIVAAALTTIIALSPLAVLSLGDLRGFAIFTILGVIIGIVLTRPAYGDILRIILDPK